MNKYVLTNNRSPNFLLFVVVLFRLAFCSSLNAQIPTWVNEGFGASPYPTSNSYYLSNAANSWQEGEVAGLVGFPNKWVYTISTGTTPTYPTTYGGFIQTATTAPNHAQFAGAGFLQYNNRNINYPNVTNISQAGDIGFISTRSLDFSGHTIYNALADTLGFWFWRDNSTVGGVNTIADSIAVYINTEPFLQGPNLVQLLEKNTSSFTIPRSSTLAPLPSPAGSGWRRYTYNVPNTAAYTGATATSNAYLIVVAYSRGGNNMFLDDFTLPEWKTTMVVDSAIIFYQENVDVGKNSTNNLILGVKIITHGSLSPLKIDAATFSSSGSTSFTTDVQNPLAYYSGASSNFGSPASVINMPLNVSGPALGLLNFGWAGASCAVSAAPVTMLLSPGKENYIWLTYDVKSTAQIGNYVGADFQFITSTTGSCKYVGSTVSANLNTNPIFPQSFGKARLIESTYAIPTYIGGLGVPGYYDFDCISAVYMPGDNSTQIENYLHDEICAGCHAVHPVGDPLNAYCIRWACHPNDYTNFKAVNAGAYKNRFIQITSGRGIRTATLPYILKILGGNVTGRIAAFIDWNKDGDFDDTYTGTTGVVAQDVVIKEYYGTHVVTAGNMTQFPVTSWIATNNWTINVPTTSDNVADLNDANQLPNNSSGPLAISNVRMRLRQCLNGVVDIGPFTNGYSEGETEDYTIQVLENCPLPGFNTCKWIGTSTDWNLNTNWCPSIPTINDLAYIPVLTGNFYYPTINANTNATCRQLKLMDNGVGIGAQLTIDANENTKFTVADDVIIGAGAPLAGSNASIAVRSNLNKKITIPGKTSIPPLGIAVGTQSPFRGSAHGKTQISYSKTELSNTYGWKIGDIIDSISFEVNTISLAPAAPSSWQNFRVRLFSVNATKTFPFPVPANTKIAVETGDINVLSTTTIYGGVGTTLMLNMPNASGGTEFNGNYYTIALDANSFVWDGNDIVLSIEYTSPTAAAIPLKSYVLYDESAGAFRTLSVNYNTWGTTITGYNIDGSGHYTGGLAGITAAVAAIRPRLDFHFHRPYQEVEIVIGGKLINNNKLTRTAAFSTTPVYNIAGDSGFIASKSRVVFNPDIRTSVTTPGYPGNPGLTVITPFNLVAQTATLSPDIDQEITSANNASTVFNGLEIDKASVTGKAVKQASTTVSIKGEFCDSLVLKNGELNLNRKEFKLFGSGGSALTRFNGWIRSEDNVGGLAGNMQSIFTWNIGTNTGSHEIPFGTSNTDVFPFMVNITSGDIGQLTVATYHTPQNNTSYPLSPVNVTSVTSLSLPAVDWTVDRFWLVKKSTGTPIAGTIQFNYPMAEGTALAAYSAGNMKAQRYEYSGTAWAWHAPYAGQSDGNPGPTFVNHNASYIHNIHTIWTIVSLNNGQTPLPIDVIDFNAKAIGNKVRLWWNVANESEVSNYIIERTIDNKNFDFISSKKPLIPSTNLQAYETYDYAPKNGLQYYRLTSNKKNGEAIYSGLKPVTIDGVFEITNASASFKNNELSIDFLYDSNAPVLYQIMDVIGNILVHGKYVATPGQNNLLIPFQAARGVYFISINNDEKRTSRKIVF